MPLHTDECAKLFPAPRLVEEKRSEIALDNFLI